MKLDEALLSSEIAEYRRTQAMRTRGFRVAESKLEHVAVCLIGAPGPVPIYGRNGLFWPVALRVVADPMRAAQRTASELWEGTRDEPHCILLDFVWVDSDQHGKRLASALYARLIADDPDMRMLNGNWIDRMDWHKAWKPCLEEAVKDIREGGETVRYYSEQMRRQRIKTGERQREQQAVGGRR